jgi:hypothetical protein
MRVFISWSGCLSQELAQALYSNLAVMLQGVQFFMLPSFCGFRTPGLSRPA